MWWRSIVIDTMMTMCADQACLELKRLTIIIIVTSIYSVVVITVTYPPLIYAIMTMQIQLGQVARVMNGWSLRSQTLAVASVSGAWLASSENTCRCRCCCCSGCQLCCAVCLLLHRRAAGGAHDNASLPLTLLLHGHINLWL